MNECPVHVDLCNGLITCPEDNCVIKRTSIYVVEENLSSEEIPNK
jgi:hypothetical protein